VTKKAAKVFVPAPRLWPGELFVCIASGPSLTADDVAYVRGRARVIAVNNGYLLAPWADVLWATDARWWRWHKGVPGFAGLKFSLWVGGLALPKDVHVLRNDGYSGLCLDPAGVKNGKNGGYAALNLALHLGASRVILLGYDCHRSGGKDHWHPEHPTKMSNPYQTWRRLFNGMAPELVKAGVSVVNCSRSSSLECFPRMPLSVALPGLREAVA
jgi:hypothetical protein